MQTSGREGGAPRAGFTLIELLIVVAIIAILAAIAVPNFLEAQVRSKIARGKADMGALATAIESYATDYGKYPPDRGIHTVNFCCPLTTPIAYITSASMDDPFNPSWNDVRPGWSVSIKDGSYLFVNYDWNYGNIENWGQAWLAQRDATWPRQGCVLSSFGPDRLHGALAYYPWLVNNPGGGTVHGVSVAENMVYDPTNGVRSIGDFGRAVGNLECPAVIGG